MQPFDGRYGAGTHLKCFLVETVKRFGAFHTAKLPTSFMRVIRTGTVISRAGR